MCGICLLLAVAIGDGCFLIPDLMVRTCEVLDGKELPCPGPGGHTLPSARISVSRALCEVCDVVFPLRVGQECG